MTEHEFKGQMTRLVSVYGDKAYPPERMSLIWREMKNAALYEFEAIVSELIGTCSYAPLIDKFRTAKSELFAKNSCDYERKLRAWVAAQPRCPYCDNYGYITATHRVNGSIQVFGCKCDVSKRLYPKYLQWSNSVYLKDYEPEFKRVVPGTPANTTINPSSLLQGMPL